MRIRATSIRKIFDSRGEPTIEVGVNAGNGMQSASVPSGKSRGMSEAAVFPFEKAKAALLKVTAKKLKGRNFDSISAFDKAILDYDTTPEKTILGGNVALGLSVAFCRGLASSKSEPVWKTLRGEFFPDVIDEIIPDIYSNFINGGRHAKDNLMIQEYMVIAKTPVTGAGKAGRGIAKTVERLISLHHQLGVVLGGHAHRNVPVGDEEGYQKNFRNNLEPLEVLQKLIIKNKLQKQFALGLDAAATNFYMKGKYVIDGKKLSADELCRHYRGWFRKVPLLASLEDPFEEGAWSDFASLQRAVPDKAIVGDDLTTTNAASIGRGAHLVAIKGVIIKPNQIGTITETCAALRTARIHGIKTIVSHRSGETEDVFIIHLAKAAGADGLKIGAPAKERLLKFDEMVRIF
jgi:enolase